MEKFFEKLNSVIGKDGKARLLINETNGELIVTVELSKPDKGWSSPAMFRGHFSVLDDNLLNDLEKGVVQIRPYMKNTEKMVDSVKPKEEVKTPVDKKNEVTAKVTKTDAKTVKAPEPEKPKPADTTINMFAEEQATKAEEEVETEDVEAEIVEEDVSGLAEASGVIADEATGEITHTVVEDDDFGTVVKPVEVVKPDYETELGRLRGLNKDGKFQEAVDGLKALLVHYPNDPAILMGIEKITAKLPPPVAPVEDF